MIEKDEAAMTLGRPLHLFEAFGVELEYMIVDALSLDVRPLADQVLHAVTGEFACEVEQGEISWSNELVLHLLELKTTSPAGSLWPLRDAFQQHVQRINRLLEPHQARLMPTAMHPWMDPRQEVRLWPHEYQEVYATYDRLFDCRRHGWGNVQSVHLNLPFANDDEFGMLHAGIRVLLPLLPALAASSPLVERQLTGLQDNRMEAYRHHMQRVPELVGQVIPEPVFTPAEYERQILQRLYAALQPLDPEGQLQQEWLNARGAIARFDRQAIEIRVLDVQEHPAADLALCATASEVLQALAEERWSTVRQQQQLPTDSLAELLLRVIGSGQEAIITDPSYLRLFGFPQVRCQVGELWHHLVEDLNASLAPWQATLQLILQQGNLSRRIVRALTATGDQSRSLEEIYRQLCECLATGHAFV